MRVLVMQSSSQTIILGSAWTTPQGTSNKLPLEQRLWPWSHERHRERDKMQDSDSANILYIPYTRQKSTDPAYPPYSYGFIPCSSFFSQRWVLQWQKPSTQLVNSIRYRQARFISWKRELWNCIFNTYWRNHMDQTASVPANTWLGSTLMERRLTLDYNRAVCHGNRLDQESKNIFNRLNSIKWNNDQESHQQFKQSLSLSHNKCQWSAKHHDIIHCQTFNREISQTSNSSHKIW